MKKIILLFIFISSMITANAQTAILEHGGASAVYTGSNALVNAYNDAVEHDIIYLGGGTFTATELNKTLSIYGAGYHPDATGVTGKTYIYSNLTIGASATSLKLEGVEVNGNLTISAEGVVIKACKMNACILGADNASLINNVILGATTCSNSSKNHIISNNIMMAGIESLSYSTISNNVIRGIVGSYYVNRRYIQGDNNIVKHNICCDATESYIYEVVTGNNNTINHNVCWHSKIANDNAGNLASENTMIDDAARASLFVNVPTDRTWRWTDDYHLQTDYSCREGIQAGIYGGDYPMRDYFLPSIPHLVSNSSSNKSNVEGKLNVSITFMPQ